MKRRRRKPVLKHKTNESKVRHKLPEVFVKAVERESSPINETEPPINDAVEYNSIFSSSTMEQKTFSENLCDRCKESLVQKDESIYSDMQLDEVSTTVLTVAHTIRNSKEQRRRMYEQEKIDEIMERVEKALNLYELDDKNGEESSEQSFIEQEVNKKKERENITNIFLLSENTGRSRYDLIQDVDNWFSISQEDMKVFGDMFIELENESSEEKFQRINKAFLKLADSINRLTNLFKKIISGNKRSKRKKASVWKVPSIESEVESSGKSETESKESSESSQELKPQRKILTEKELICIQTIKMAVKTVSSILDEGVRSSTGLKMKSNFKTGVKQFKTLWNVLERKLEYILELEEKMKQYSSETTNHQFVIEQKKNDNIKIKKLKIENINLQEKVETLQSYIDNLDAEAVTNIISNVQEHERKVSINIPLIHKSSVVSMESKNSSIHLNNLHTNISKRRSMSLSEKSCLQTSKAVSISAYSTEGVSQRISAVSSQKLSELDEDLQYQSSFEPFEVNIDSSFNRSNNLISQTSELSHDTVSLGEQQRNEHFMKSKSDIVNNVAYLELLDNNTKCEKKIEQLEQQIKRAYLEVRDKTEELKVGQKLVEQYKNDIQELIDQKNSLAEEPEIMNFDLSELPRDQAIEKLKIQSKKEVQNLRNYIVKEQHRFQANLRRVHLDHKKYVAGLRNENVQMIRALNRFKHVVIRLLQQENLADSFGDEIDEDDEMDKLRLYQEGKEVLTLPQTAIEMLVSLEKNLNKVLLQKRLMMKDAHIYKQNAEKDLLEQRSRLQKTTYTCAEQEKLMIKTANYNQLLTNQYTSLWQNNQILQKEIAPCQKLLDKYNCLQKEVERLNTEEKTAAKETREIIKEFETDRNFLKKELHKMNLAQICQLDIVSSSWKGRNCREKIKLIDKAFERNRISAEDHDKATDILKYSNKLTNQYFIGLVHRYVAYKQLQTTKDAVNAASRKSRNKKRFQTYIARLEQRHEETTRCWHEKKDQLITMRENALALFMELLRQQPCGDLSISSFPLFKDKPQACKQHIENSVKKRSPDNRDTEIYNITGKHLTNDQGMTSYWQMPPTVPQHLVRITTPKILELDVNSLRKPYKGNKNVYFPAIATLYP